MWAMACVALRWEGIFRYSFGTAVSLTASLLDGASAAVLAWLAYIQRNAAQLQITSAD
jgi:hypothetical protein